MSEIWNFNHIELDIDPDVVFSSMPRVRGRTAAACHGRPAWISQCSEGDKYGSTDIEGVETEHAAIKQTKDAGARRKER
jgi:hypothetical protein